MASPGRTLSARLLLWYGVACVFLFGGLAFFIHRSVENTLTGGLTENLIAGVELAALSIPAERSEYQEWASEVFASGDFRVTVVDSEGVVLADSHSDPSVMQNHADRPEIVEAIETGQPGTAVRVSVSTGFEQLYVALPPEEGLTVRGSIPSRVISQELAAIRGSIVIAAAIAGLIGAVLVFLLGRRTARSITELTFQAERAAAGGLDLEPRRSPVYEVDRLGLAISSLASDLSRRVTEGAADYLEVVLGAIPQGTVLIGSDDSVVYANPSAEHLLGVIPESLSGLAPFPLQTLVRDAREGTETLGRTMDYSQPRRTLRAAATPFLEDDRTLLVLVDVTDQERVASVRRDFVANASHELKTPVSSIIAASEALRIAVRRKDYSAGRFADQIERSALQLDSLVADLLDLSRLERESPELSPVRMEMLVAEEVERARPEAESKNISLCSELEPATVVASHGDMAVAVRNLLDNAVRYTPEDGAVEVNLGNRAAVAAVSVSDNGEGIPSRDIERIFERFYRVDAARSRATGGTGLGLSIVRHVAESHGGEVSVESELGVGSTFTITVPVFDGVDDDDSN